MKASEVRIGNIIESFNTNGNPNEWIEWKINYAWQIEEVEYAEEIKKEWFRGIPLTEEWLLKFGFKSVGKLHPTYKFKHLIIEASLMHDHYILRQIINKDDSLALNQNLRYVHQLQNLFFCLTGEELTIKP